MTSVVTVVHAMVCVDGKEVSVYVVPGIVSVKPGIVIVVVVPAVAKVVVVVKV